MGLSLIWVLSIAKGQGKKNIMARKLQKIPTAAFCDYSYDAEAMCEWVLCKNRVWQKYSENCEG